jgi:hypothetical protein
MELKAFKVTALIFPQSSLTAEYIIYGRDENDAITNFERQYPSYCVKSVEETLD